MKKSKTTYSDRILLFNKILFLCSSLSFTSCKAGDIEAPTQADERRGGAGRAMDALRPGRSREDSGHLGGADDSDTEPSRQVVNNPLHGGPHWARDRNGNALRHRSNQPW